MDAISAEIGIGQEHAGVGLGLGAQVGVSPKGRWQQHLQQLSSPHAPQEAVNLDEDEDGEQGASAEANPPSARETG